MSKIKAAILILLVLTVTFSGGLISAEEVDGLEISSQPLTITEEGYSYNYQVRVENQDGEDLNYSLHNAPADMDIDGRGLVTWTPGGERAGEYDIEIRVTTGNGNEVSQDYTLLVAEAINNEPDIISEPKTEVQEGEEYNYEVEAEDADGDNIVYHLSEKPEGMCIDQVSGEIIWEPGMEQTGEHSVRIVASDKDDSSEQSYSLEVEPINKSPKIVSSPRDEGEAGEEYTYRVIAVDYDEDDLDYELEESPEEMEIDSETGLIEWEPEEEQTGEHEVVISVSDGELNDSQEYRLEILEPVNDDPVITSIPPTKGKEGEEYNYSVEAMDPDSEELKYSLQTGPEDMSIGKEDGEIIWVPGSTQSGKHEVEIVVEDGDGGEASQYYVIAVEEAVNTSPEIISEPVTEAEEKEEYSYQVEVRDDDDDPLEYSLAEAPVEMKISESGLITWTPERGDAGNYEIVIEVSDDRGGLTEQEFTLEIESINNPPVIDNVEKVEEGEDYLQYEVMASDSDGDMLSYALEDAPAGMEIDEDTGEITWDISGIEDGEYETKIIVNDPYGGEDTTVLNVTLETTEPPEIESEPETTAYVGELYEYNVSASDPDSDELSYKLDMSPTGMEIEEETGKITWTPEEDQESSHEVRIKVTDGEGGEATQEFELVVEKQNKLPEITSTPETEVEAGEEYIYQVEATDPDGDELEYKLDAAPSGMEINEEGTISWTPEEEQEGSHQIILLVTDGQGGEAYQEYTLAVNTENEPPRILSTPVTTVEPGEDYIYEIEAEDPDGDELTFALEEKPGLMSVDSEAGQIEWAPGEDDVGEHEIVVRVEDDRGGFAEQTFVLRVEEDIENNPPEIISEPSRSVRIGEEYSYQVEAEDKDGDTLSFSLTEAPEEMDIDTSGLITWTPGEVDTGSHTVAVEVSDSQGGTAEQTYEVEVTEEAENREPNILSAPSLTASAGEKYTYEVEAEDPDGDELEYGLVEAPEGMSIDADTGKISWIPAEDEAGEHRVTVEVSDGKGGSDVQSYLLKIEDGTGDDTQDLLKPEVNLVLSRETANVGQSVDIQVEVEDEGEIEEITLEAAGEEIELDSQNRASYQSEEPGLYKVVATVTDDAGNTGYDRKELRFLDDSESSPTAEIISPEGGAVLSSPAEIVGTVADEEELTYYRLEYSPQDKDEYVTFTEGTDEIEEDVLGTLDTSQMRNGYYDIRLRAENSGGRYIMDTKTYKVEGQKKIGNFTVSFEDMNIPVAGIPITVNRTYDSRDRTKGDFGWGWKLELNTITLGESCTPGKYWEMNVTEDHIGLPVYHLVPYRDHFVTIDYPDGTSDKFRMELDPDTQELAPLEYTDVIFEPVGSTDAELEALTDNYVQIITTDQGVELLSMDTNETYDPDRYKLTRSDGTELIISQKDGLQRITDKDGNRINITDSGISHSSGKGIDFTRDSEGRITSITDPEGNTVNYRYDSYGDLVSVIDREGNTTSFTYNMNHGLVDIINPNGVQATRNEYDDNGRLISQEDEDGNRIEYTHNTGENQEVVEDRRGNISVYDYDEDGNVVAETDALGNTKTYAYDNDGNKTSETDELGNTTEYTYDVNGNKLSETDPAGSTHEYEYNDSSQLEVTIDPEGNKRKSEYDEEGNLVKSADPSGNVTEYTYDESGNMTSEIDPRGNETTYNYDEYGNLIEETDPEGNVTTYKYDSNGNRTEKTETRTTASGEKTLTTSYEYDAEGNLIKTVHPDGSISRTEYNELGEKSAEIDRLGNRTEYEYDHAGNLIKTIYPDGTEETSTYDAEDNKISETDREGNTTTYEYDELNRRVKTIYPDGSSKETVYDEAGRAEKEIDTRGNETVYEYDENGNCTAVTDAAGNTVEYKYNKLNQRTKMIDEKGNTTEYKYNDRGMKTETIYSDGTKETVEYDANGNKIAETDQAGITTEYEYDSRDRLVKVIDAEGNETEYTYDEAGNKLTETDAEGNTTSFAYDEMGRLVEKTLPLGMTETYSYDEAGNRISHTDFNEDTIEYDYDSCQRLIEKTYPDGSSETYTYTDNGKKESVTTSDGTTYFEYDERNRLIKKVDADGREIEYKYDTEGNRTALITFEGTTEYTFDELNRLETVIDPDGGETTYTYDDNGNRASVTYPNGTITEYSYDSLNRLTELISSREDGTVISSYEYTLDDAGNRIKVEENGGRVVKYTYDKLYRLEKEEISDPDTGDSTISYTYDAVGNRLSKTVDGETTDYEYDANNRLEREGDTLYTYDDNGNTTLKINGDGETNYQYDSGNHLIEVEGPDGKIEYGYDFAGNRTEKIVDGQRTEYLVDTNRSNAQVLLEKDSSDNIAVSYTYGDDLISQNRSGEVSYYHYDGQGSTRALTDNAGTVTDTYTYDAFGELLERTGDTKNDYLYTGEQYDPNIGFYYLRARYMDPSLGRFVTRDTWQGDKYDPRTLHKYLYTGNNPVNYDDPSGHFFGIFSISGTLTTNTIVAKIRLKHDKMHVNNMIDLQEIGDVMLRSGVKLREISLNLMANNHWLDGYTWECYEAARKQEAAAYELMGKAMMKNAADFGVQLMNLIEVKIFDDIKEGLGDLLTPDIEDPMDDVNDNLQGHFDEIKDLKDVNDEMIDFNQDLKNQDYDSARKISEKLFDKMEKLIDKI